MTGQYIVVCDTCGYVSSQPSDIELAGEELEAHIKDNEKCPIKKIFLEEVIPKTELIITKFDEYVPRDNRVFWVCAHCRPPKKFQSGDEYVGHHYYHN